MTEPTNNHLAAPVETDVAVERVRSGGPSSGPRHVDSVKRLEVGQCHVIARTAPDDLSVEAMPEWVRTATAQLKGQASKVVQRIKASNDGANYTLEGATTLMPISGKAIVFFTITRTA